MLRFLSSLRLLIGLVGELSQEAFDREALSG
jgi:hypothetical protein